MTMPAFLSSRPIATTEATDAPFTLVPNATFDQVGVAMTFADGEEIYAQEEETDFVYEVQTGAVRASRLLSDGRRQIAGFYYPGDLFGLETGATHRSSAEAIGATRVLVAKRSALKHYGDAGAQAERAIWRATGAELERAHEHMMLLARKSAFERVAGLLADIAKRQARAWSALPMSRQDMADHLGLSIETVSRMVTQMQVEGLVVFDGCRRFRVAAPGRLALLATV